MSEPAQVVEALLSALDERRWRDAAALFTPAFLADFKRRAPAHYGPSWSDHFAGVHSEEELAALDAAETWARHLEATDPGTRYARVLAALKAKHPEHAAKLGRHSPTDARWWDRYRVAGTVADGSRAYVIVRERAAQRNPAPAPSVDDSPEMYVLRSTPEGWRVSSEPGGGRNLIIAGVSVEGENGEMVTLS